MGCRVLISVLTNKIGDKSYQTFSDIMNQTTEGIEMSVVVIDWSSNGEVRRILNENFPKINVISTKENLGFSGGHNLAVELALKKDVDFLFILNDDIRISKDYILKMTLEGLKRNDAAALGSIIRFPNGRISARPRALKCRG